MDPEEFRKKYGFPMSPPEKAPRTLDAAATVIPARQVIPGDVRQLFPGNVPGAPAPAPASEPVGPTVSPFLTGTDPAAQEAQAAFFE